MLGTGKFPMLIATAEMIRETPCVVRPKTPNLVESVQPVPVSSQKVLPNSAWCRVSMRVEVYALRELEKKRRKMEDRWGPGRGA